MIGGSYRRLGGVLCSPHADLIWLIDSLEYPHAKIESEGTDYTPHTDRRRLDMTMIRVVDGDSRSVVVEITTEIREGHWYRINPSEAYMGIESGVVEVTAILSGIKELDSKEVYVEGVNTEDLIHMIEVHKEGVLDLMEGTEYYDEELNKLDNGLWIVYKYQRDGEWNVLPLEEFVGHTMHY